MKRDLKLKKMKYCFQFRFDFVLGESFELYFAEIEEGVVVIKTKTPRTQSAVLCTPMLTICFFAPSLNVEWYLPFE